MNKSKVLEAMGRKPDADSFRAKALDKANALQLYIYGRQLQGEKKQDEALAIYQSTAKKFPDYWTTHLGLARVYSAKGDFDNAAKELKLSLKDAPDANKNALEAYAKRLEAKDDINK
jgi:tetratricopeptide (TPR) repeat protein